MQNSIKLMIYGCGGHARSILNTVFEAYEKDTVILVDENARENERILGCRTLREDIQLRDVPFIVAAGDNVKRMNIFKNNMMAGREAISIISKTAEIGVDARIGQGTFVAKNVYIGPEVRIGQNSIINTNAVIEHETTIGSHTHVAPRAVICGRCKVGSNVFIGAGAVIKDNIEICDNVMIGAGAVVVKNILEQGIYVGVPCKKMKKEMA